MKRSPPTYRKALSSWIVAAGSCADVMVAPATARCGLRSPEDWASSRPVAKSVSKNNGFIAPLPLDRRAGRVTGLTPLGFPFRGLRFRRLLRGLLRACILRTLRSRSCAQTQRGRMPRLVEADLQPAGEFDGGH